MAKSFYSERFENYYDELKWLYIELYNDEAGLARLSAVMEKAFSERTTSLKKQDREREASSDRYNTHTLSGITFVSTDDNMEGKAVSCHKKHMLMAAEFEMSYVPRKNLAVKRALRGVEEYRNRFYIFDNNDEVNRYDENAFQPLPYLAPGNFTYLPENKEYVMTTFHSDQWDLNYHNCDVFNDMVKNLLELINRGVDVVKLSHMAYIWKCPGTKCINNPEVHSILRMIRIIVEIVSPGVILLGDKPVIEDTSLTEETENTYLTYFGTAEKPECHFLYNYMLESVIWHTLATGDCKLLKEYMDRMTTFPKNYCFLNYLRDEEPLKWCLNFKTLEEEGIKRDTHVEYLNDYYCGNLNPESAFAELIYDDEIDQSVNSVGLMGSASDFVGLYKNMKDSEKKQTAFNKICMMITLVFMITGIPYISDDEVGMKGVLIRLRQVKLESRAFNLMADTWTMDTWDKGTFAIGRYFEGQKLLGVFNFTDEERTAWINENDGEASLLSQ